MSNNKSGDDAFGGFTANSYQKNWRRNKKKEGARGPVRKKKQRPSVFNKRMISMDPTRARMFK